MVKHATIMCESGGDTFSMCFPCGKTVFFKRGKDKIMRRLHTKCCGCCKESDTLKLPEEEKKRIKGFINRNKFDNEKLKEVQALTARVNLK